MHEIRAEMPSTVIALECSEGEFVQKDRVVFILESMKMEFLVKAGAEGEISYAVAVGQGVERGTLLARVIAHKA